MNDGAALVPFDIPGVPPEVRDNVFAPLDQTLNRHIDALSERPRSETGDVSLGFFKDLRETLDGELRRCARWLDPEERFRFQDLLAELARERVILLSTHIVSDVTALCHRMAIIQNGLIATQATRSFWSTPLTTRSQKRWMLTRRSSYSART